MNVVVMTGRITKDIVVRKVGANETPICKFVLAVPGVKKDRTEFVSCVAWGKVAETMGQYLKKGDRIGARGRIETDVYEKDGKKVYTTEFIVENFEFGEKKKESKTEENAEFVEVNEEDLPFTF